MLRAKIRTSFEAVLSYRRKPFVIITVYLIEVIKCSLLTGRRCHLLATAVSILLIYGVDATSLWCVT